MNPRTREVQIQTGALRGFLKLSGAYFWQERSARWMVLGLFLLTLLQILIQIRFNLWNRDFFNALENRDRDAFFWQMWLFLLLALASMVTAVYQLYVKQLTQLRWRQWLTRKLIGAWMTDARHYQMEKAGGADNPDQRIAEDVRAATEMALDFATGIFNAVVMLIAFIGILWTISGPLYLTLFGRDVVIPGYMVWAALIYAVVGSALTYLVGRPMVMLNFHRTSREADFRFSLVRARENSEGIALIGGERDERRALDGIFAHTAAAVKALMQSQRRLMWLTSAYGMLTYVFPTVVAAPSYFSGAITLGGLMQIGSAFGSVQSSLNWFVDNFPRLAEWRSSVERLLTFHEALKQVEGMVSRPENPVIARSIVKAGGKEPETLSFRDVQVAFADGSVVIAEASGEIKAGERVLIKGESGTGKSTLFRAFAGVWPWGSGEIRMPPAESTIFMPQRPYLPLGSLRNALAYPLGAEKADDEISCAALRRVGLGKLCDRLDQEERWDQLLSLGEQQRLAFARLFIQRPHWIFMDEATAALDEENQNMMMRMLIEELPDSALISIGHRPGLEFFHHRVLMLQHGPEGAKLAIPPRPQVKLRRIGDRLPKLQKLMIRRRVKEDV
ncbi:ABC transporter ATP-binding protein/permease [Roseomonas gilardii]|uniref:ABC transporter ATP-binding protein/permease n=1 Tax=Roseomonas gilardii TaxID=257708 RepID=A0ABU3MQC8_9PROT|nr:ABC transporter ATP-binding protein/permease [Roseomonas gilardii]MDT8333959.1 ABC transporter ATP-binding protein/permease [Roseomonas gilardii]PZR08178.1 MAG: ABC transporter ATP-binding protein [Azospirillum brasilense]